MGDIANRVEGAVIATFRVIPATGNTAVFKKLEIMCQFHDHLKILNDEFQRARHEDAYANMRNLEFRTNKGEMARYEAAWFTSLVFKLNWGRATAFTRGIQSALNAVSEAICTFYPSAEPQQNFEAAHITVRSMADYIRQSPADLQPYAQVLRPVVHKWLKRMPETRIYLMGLFAHVQEEKGISVGLRVYPTLPLFQVLRGEAARVLYMHRPKLCLRPIHQFHTMLTHSTLLRFRSLPFPLGADAVNAFKAALENADRTVFGEIKNLQAADFSIRNGMTDKLLLKDAQRNVVGHEISFEGDDRS